MLDTDRTTPIKETRKAVFLDRDGVLVREMARDGKCYTPLALEEMEIMPGVRQAAQILRAHGFLIFVVTNQPDIARGKLARAVLEEMHARLWEALGGKPVVSDIYVCPHDNQDACECRKPKPGMLLRAAAQWNLDLGKCFFIGDHSRDMGAGRAAGCRTVLIRKDYNQGTEADEIACDLEDAVRRVMGGRSR